MTYTTFFGWLSKDGKLLYLTKSITSFSNNFVTVFFVVYLSLLGIPLWQAGLVLTGGLLFSTMLNVITGYTADRMGRKKTLVFYTLLTSISALVFTFVDVPFVVIFCAVLSSLGSRSGFGPVAMLERVILAQSCSNENRTKMYAIYNTLGSLSGALGYLFGGFPAILQNVIGFDQLMSFRIMFLVYSILGFSILMIYFSLSQKVEIEVITTGVKEFPLSMETRRIVMKLSLLFSLDSFGGGLVTSSLVSYWFFQRFGLSVEYIGVIFFISSLLASISFILAAKIAGKIGLIKTMVYSHLPTSLSTAFIPFMPTLQTSVLLYTSRSLLSQMDVPTRQSYTMAIVKPEERTRVGGLINLPRSITQAISPFIAALLMQYVGFALPFILTGITKSFYDISLFFTFRNIKPLEEMENTES